MIHCGYGVQWAQEAEEKNRAPERDTRLWRLILEIVSVALVTLAYPVPAYLGHNIEGTKPVYFLCPAMFLRGSWHRLYVTDL